MNPNDRFGKIISPLKHFLRFFPSVTQMKSLGRHGAKESGKGNIRKGRILDNPKRQIDFSKCQTTEQSSDNFFGLEQAPVFYPTPQEFEDPIRYIESIRHIGELAGICKVIPPSGWAPGVHLNSNTEFVPRIQYINSVEGVSRVSLNYMERCSKYHARAGLSLKVPNYNDVRVDLLLLKNLVKAKGGHEKVGVWQCHFITLLVLYSF